MNGRRKDGGDELVWTSPSHHLTAGRRFVMSKKPDHKRMQFASKYRAHPVGRSV